LDKLNRQLLEIKNEYDLNSLVKGGRIFYEFEIVDEINDSISDCIYQGEIISKDKFHQKFYYGWIIYIGLGLLIFSGLIYYCFFYKRNQDLKIE